MDVARDVNFEIQNIRFESPKFGLHFEFDSARDPGVYFIQVYRRQLRTPLSWLFQALALVNEPLDPNDQFFVNHQNVFQWSFWQHQKIRSRIGISFDSGGLLPHLTLGENWRLGFWNRPHLVTQPVLGYPLLEKFHLDSFWNFYPHQVSGQVRKKYVLLRAIVHEPDLLFLDDPWSGLDQSFVKTLSQFIIQSAFEGKIRFVFVWDPALLPVFPFNRYWQL